MRTKPTQWEIALAFSTLVFFAVSLFGVYRYEQLRKELQFWKQDHYLEQTTK